MRSWVPVVKNLATLSKSSLINWALLLCLLALTIGVRLPILNSGSGYFYDEDEAHHFNRQVQMAQTRDLNPKYFLKPSLNFYMRLPAIAAGFKYSQQTSSPSLINTSSIKDVKTKDKFGLAGYSFNASHLDVLKADQLLTIGMVSLITALVFILTFLLTKNSLLSVFAGLAYSLSPLSLEHSLSVGVNQPASLFCIASILFAALFNLRRSLHQSQYLLVISAIFAGLAISTKYNAAPIILVPIVSVLASRPVNWKRLFIAGGLPVIFFFLASPYILFESKLFIKHVSYEIWHYSKAGHVGHEAKPGWDQALFYINNLGSHSLGWAVFSLSVLGLLILSLSKIKSRYAILIFPLSFMLMMVMQKANFDRNLLLPLPVFAIFSALGLQTIFKQINNSYMRLFIALLVLFQPALSSYQYLRSQLSTEESRLAAFDYLHQPENSSVLALDGNLEFKSFTKQVDGKTVLSRPGTSRLDLSAPDLSKLFLDGYEEILLPLGSKLSHKNPIFQLKKIFTGNLLSRIVKNPAMMLIRFESEKILNSPEILQALTAQTVAKDICSTNENLWINQRIVRVVPCSSNIKLFNSWDKQVITTLDNNFKILSKIEIATGNSEISLPGDTQFIWLDKIRSPQAQGLSDDKRRLGIEIQK